MVASHMFIPYVYPVSHMWFSHMLPGPPYEAPGGCSGGGPVPGPFLLNLPLWASWWPPLGLRHQQ